MKKQALKSTMKGWDDVNSALETLSTLTIDIRFLENQKTEQINAINASYDELSKPIMQQKAALEADIEAYVMEHKDEFITVRTKELTHGKISLRVSKAIRVISKAVCVKALKAIGWDDYIIVKEEPNKDMLATCDDIQLAKVACERKVTDNITIEPNLEELCS